MLLLLQGAGTQVVVAVYGGGVGEFRSSLVRLERQTAGFTGQRDRLNVPRKGFRPVNPRRVE